MYPVGHDLRLTDQGDLRIWISPRFPNKPGYGYGITLIERADIKRISGKAIKSE
jgi:hypothetical protein